MWVIILIIHLFFIYWFTEVACLFFRCLLFCSWNTLYRLGSWFNSWASLLPLPPVGRVQASAIMPSWSMILRKITKHVFIESLILRGLIISIDRVPLWKVIGEHVRSNSLFLCSVSFWVHELPCPIPWGEEHLYGGWFWVAGGFNYLQLNSFMAISIF